MRKHFVFFLLLVTKLLSRLLYRVRLEWVEEPEDPWSDLRVLVMLNHTSLFEPIFAAVAPNRLLWQIAAHGVVPVADKTAARPIVGRFFRLVAHQVVPITRTRDDTWTDVMSRVHDPKALVVILPEGRMKRRSGLDMHGNPMTLRGGIADILAAVPHGRALVTYSGGLHHVHAPGDRFPRFFKRVRLTAEVIDIPAYREALVRRFGREAFKRAVVDDLTRRRDAYCLCDDAHPVESSGDAAGLNESARARTRPREGPATPVPPKR